MQKRLVMYCDTSYNCCLSNCYGDSNIKQLIKNSDIIFEHWNNTNKDMITKYGLDKSPTILLFENNTLRQKIIGKNIDSKVKNILNSIPWL